MSEKTPPDWDPPPGKRMYVRSARTGQLGYIVRRGGKDVVRLDRPARETIVKFDRMEWLQEFEHRPFSRAQLVEVAFEADKTLLRMLGDHERSRKDWRSLSEKARLAWIQEGPSNPPIRRILYNAIMSCLEENTVQ